MKKYLAALMVVGIIAMTGCSCHKKETLHFDSDSFALTQEDRMELDRAATKLSKKEEQRVRIYGYADSTGTKAHNKKLSMARAHAAAAYLEGRGVNANRITVAAFGEEHPTASNKTKEGRRENRRVEIQFYR